MSLATFCRYELSWNNLSSQNRKQEQNLRILSKAYLYLQTMTKTPVNFQKNRYKTIGGVAPTWYPLSIHFVIDNARKKAKFNLRKK